MQQFWYTIKKVQGIDSYEFLLSNKKYVVNADIFRTIIDICPRVEGVDFTDVPDHDATLAFSLSLDTKDHYTSTPTCLKEKKSRRENMPFPRFTKTMLTEAIKQSESYQMFIKYSTSQIPPKKSRGKGSQGKKTTDTHVADVDVSEESYLRPSKRKTASRRVVKNKVTISTDDNTIIDDPDVALEIMTESVPEPTRRIKSSKVTSNPPIRLKGVLSLTSEEQEAADTMHALKECRKTSRRQLDTGGSNEGTGTILGVPNESTIVSATSSEGTESKYSEEDILDDEEKDDKDGDADDEGNDHISDTQDADDEDVETESDVDEIYKYKIHVHKDVDAEMTKTEIVEHENKEKDIITDAAKPAAEKSVEEEGGAEKAAGSNFQVKESTEFPLPSLVCQFHLALKVPVLVIPETTNLPPIPEILTETPVSTTVSSPHVTATISTIQQTSTPIPTPPVTTDAPTITTAVPESDALFAVQLRVAKLEKDMSELKKIDLSGEALAALKTHVPSVVDNYIGSKQIPELPKNQTPTVDLEQESEKSPSEILKIKKEQDEKQKIPKFTIKSTDKAALKEFDQKSALYQTMHANESFNRNPANHILTKESESSKNPFTTKETPKGKAPSKGSKTGKSASAKEPVEEPTTEVVMDDAGKDVVRDDQPQDTSKPKTAKTLNPEWFTQPPRPPTLDPK
ncbi:hypothetical protein Tco_1367720 [Tanacetum coccineum]